MTKETCLTWLKQKLAAKMAIEKNWMKYGVEFNRATQAEVKLLKELITEVECS